MEIFAKYHAPYGIGGIGRSRALRRAGARRPRKPLPSPSSAIAITTPTTSGSVSPEPSRSRLDVSIDFTDETSLLNAETLDGYKMLIVLRDGMIWPDGYGGDESTNAAWVATGRPKLVFDPPLPQERAQSQFWMKPEQGKAVRQIR